jgi:hypothetical protein
MRIITSRRGGGKTQFLIGQLYRNPRCVLMTHRANELRRQHPDCSDRIFYYDDTAGPTLGQMGDIEVMIDDLEVFLEHYFRRAALGDITTSLSVTELNPQIIKRAERNDAGQHYMVPPPSKPGGN